ncbi:MAG: hypothetical protein QXL94_00540 [Candidatus Parvarchaeum sp.]
MTISVPGRNATRLVLFNFFEPLLGTDNFPSYVTTVYPADPFPTEQDYNGYISTVGPNLNGSSAVLAITMYDQEVRSKFAMTGWSSVNDMLYLPVTIKIYFMSRASGSLFATPEYIPAVQAQLDYDIIVDYIEELVSEYPTFNSSYISLAGKDPTGITHQQSELFQDPNGMAYYLVGSITFTVEVQIVNANLFTF